MRVNLHTHSVCSDGDLTPAALAAYLAKLPLDAAALTDHDTDVGTEAFAAEAERLGLQAIPGIEISAFEDGEIHILGYRCPLMRDDAAFRARLKPFFDARCARIEKILRKLRALGISIGTEDADALGTVVPTRYHLARILVKKGVVGSVAEAYDRYLGNGRPAWTDYERMPAADAVEAVTDAGGIAVLAHPGRIRRSEESLRALVARLTDRGLKGIESYYPTHTNSETEGYRELASEFGLVSTNGSDFHRTDGDPGRGAAFERTAAEEATAELLGIRSGRRGTPI